MLAWLISLAKKVAFIYLFVKLIGAVWECYKEQSETSRYLKIKNRFANYKFERTTAVLVSRDRNCWSETKRDYLNDRHDIEYEWNLFEPDVEKHIHTKAYKEVLHEGPLRSHYEIEVNGSLYGFISDEHTEKVLPVYYNIDIPLEIYTVDEIEKSYYWTDDDEKKFMEEKLKGSKWLIGFWAVILVIFVIVF